MFNPVSDSVLDQERASVVPQRRSALSRRGRVLIAAVAACASLVGCASTTDVVATDKPGTYTVAASATGGKMAWARAHEHAISEARDYCERRGMQSSVTTETVSGVQMMTEHASSVNFECHPTF
jgi:UDP-N-acetylglucosamine enolpyruvyl transferase